jgi:hypothetical protein
MGEAIKNERWTIVLKYVTVWKVEGKVEKIRISGPGVRNFRGAEF